MWSAGAISIITAPILYQKKGIWIELRFAVLTTCNCCFVIPILSGLFQETLLRTRLRGGSTYWKKSSLWCEQVIHTRAPLHKILTNGLLWNLPRRRKASGNCNNATEMGIEIFAVFEIGVYRRKDANKTHWIAPLYKILATRWTYNVWKGAGVGILLKATALKIFNGLVSSMSSQSTVLSATRKFCLSHKVLKSVGKKVPRLIVKLTYR